MLFPNRSDEDKRCGKCHRRCCTVAKTADPQSREVAAGGPLPVALTALRIAELPGAYQSVANNIGLPRRALVEAEQPSLSGRLYGLAKLPVGQAAVDFRILSIADLTRRMVLGNDVDVRVRARF